MTSPKKSAEPPSAQAPAVRTDSRAFEQRAQATYREATRRLDPATAARLHQVRRDALAAASSGHPWRARRLLSAGALAALALAALLSWHPLQYSNRSNLSRSGQPSSAQQGSAPPIDAGDADAALPPDADTSDAALYENLDFYRWLAVNDGANGGKG